MAMGPLYSYNGQADLERLLDAMRSLGADVNMNSPEKGAIRCRRGFGLVSGHLCGTATRPAIYLGFGHPYNPFLWRSDAKLLADVEKILQTNGSRKLPPDDADWPFGGEYEIRVDDQMLSVYRRENDREKWRLRWGDIEEVVAWKFDLFTIDCICMTFVYVGSDLNRHVDEQMVGWDDLQNALERKLGIKQSEWWSAVAFPAFARNQQTIWTRA